MQPDRTRNGKGEFDRLNYSPVPRRTEVRRTLLHLIPDQRVFRFFQEQRSDNERQTRNGNRIVKTRVYISRLRYDRQSNQRQQPTEYSIADVIRQRECRVSNFCRERLDQIGGYWTVDESNED